MLKEKYSKKYFGFSKMDKKKCPKMKRGEIVWEKHVL